MTEKGQFTEKCSLSSFEDISEIKGLWVKESKARETPEEASRGTPRSFATPATRGSLVFRGRVLWF